MGTRMGGLNASLVFLHCRIFCFTEAQRTGVGRVFTAQGGGCTARLAAMRVRSRGRTSSREKHWVRRRRHHRIVTSRSDTLRLGFLLHSFGPSRALRINCISIALQETFFPVDERSIIRGRDAWTWTGKRAPQVLTGSISLAVCALLRLMKRPISGATFDGVARPGCIDCYFCRWLPSCEEADFLCCAPAQLSKRRASLGTDFHSVRGFFHLHFVDACMHLRLLEIFTGEALDVFSRPQEAFLPFRYRCQCTVCVSEPTYTHAESRPSFSLSARPLRACRQSPAGVVRRGTNSLK
ncbi:hypothetical protein DFH08DRAFT_434113 [Mycena albidolilacea]|uniref:Secreted protein n=1 Tax=Mycena albidolilacea TaxID=1033008 RepID=A0AAD6ZA63_9AGAR|nr:hypothetical protein DFH08DRAFT_434113 [Mycena albidolilacea]